MTVGTRNDKRRFRKDYSTFSDEPGSPPFYQDLRTDIANTEGWSGTDLPGFRVLIAEQLKATNAYSSRKTTVQGGAFGHAHAVRKYKVGITPYRDTANVTGALGQFDIIGQAPSVLPSALNQAKGRFISNARQAMSPFQGGVFLGELREAIELFHNPAKALYHGVVETYAKQAKKIARRYKNGAYKQPKGAGNGLKQANRDLSKLWLQFVFGWKPLIQDIQSGIEATARLLSYPNPLERVSSGGQAEASIGVERLLSSVGDIGWNWQRSTKTDTSVRLWGAFSTDPQRSGFSAARDLYGFNWQDFIPTVWELIPYSFLVDYFTNIGDMISAASFCKRNFVYYGSSVRSRLIQSLSGFDYAEQPLSSNIVEGFVDSGNATCMVVQLTRSDSPTLVPSFQFEVPGLSSTRWLNIAALAGARTGS